MAPGGSPVARAFHRMRRLEGGAGSMTFLSFVWRGVAAGAAGTTALNATTYLDMALRGRPSSSTPQESVEALADKTGLGIPGDGDKRDNRLSGLGPLLGILAGAGSGA